MHNIVALMAKSYSTFLVKFMKTKIISGIFYCSLGAAIWMGNSLGRAAGGNSNSTVNGCSNNGSCHAGANFQGALKLSVKKNGSTVTKYIPGAIYEVELAVEKTGGLGNPAGYGFQLTASKGGKDAGVFSNVMPKGNTQISKLNNRSFVEHDLLIPSGTVTVNWTAPPAGTGNVTFFAAGNLVNGAEGVKGDAATPPITLVLSEGMGVSTADFGSEKAKIKVINNPSEEQYMLNCVAEKSGNAEIFIFGADGRQVYYASVAIDEGENTLPLQFGAQDAGIFVVCLKVDGKLTTARFAKMR